jgi:hypothetical protein
MRENSSAAAMLMTFSPALGEQPRSGAALRSPAQVRTRSSARVPRVAVVRGTASRGAQRAARGKTARFPK